MGVESKLGLSDGKVLGGFEKGDSSRKDFSGHAGNHLLDQVGFELRDSPKVCTTTTTIQLLMLKSLFPLCKP